MIGDALSSQEAYSLVKVDQRNHCLADAEGLLVNLGSWKISDVAKRD